MTTFTHKAKADAPSFSHIARGDSETAETEIEAGDGYSLMADDNYELLSQSAVSGLQFNHLSK